MDFWFAVTEAPQAPAAVSLRTVYHVLADPSYDVRKNGMPHKDVVALRTLVGLGRVTVEGQGELTASPGTLMFFGHDLVRRYWCASEHWDFWWFEFSAVDTPNLPMNRAIGLDAAEGESGDCEACLRLLGKAGRGAARLSSATFSVLLSKWEALYGAWEEGVPHRRAVDGAIDLMRESLGEPVPVAELARRAGLCERRFREVFRQATGMQPKKYQEALRIGAASELLRNTPLSVGEIAQRLGYSSPFHFCRAFREKHGMPPTRFRQNAQRRGG